MPSLTALNPILSSIDVGYIIFKKIFAQNKIFSTNQASGVAVGLVLIALSRPICSVRIEAWAPADVKTFIHDYIQTYFDNAKMDGTVDVTMEFDNNEYFYRVKVDTNANAVLIGRQGRTLQDFINPQEPQYRRRKATPAGYLISTPPSCILP